MVICDSIHIPRQNVCKYFVEYIVRSGSNGAGSRFSRKAQGIRDRADEFSGRNRTVVSRVILVCFLDGAILYFPLSLARPTLAPSTTGRTKQPRFTCTRVLKTLLFFLIDFRSSVSALHTDPYRVFPVRPSSSRRPGENSGLVLLQTGARFGFGDTRTTRVFRCRTTFCVYACSRVCTVLHGVAVPIGTHDLRS